MSEVNIYDVLKDKVKLTVGIIGCGNAGNQFVDKAYKAGYQQVFCVNSSMKDLDDNVINPKVNGFMVGTDGQGAGMDRNVAKELFKVNVEKMFNKEYLKNMLEDSDIIFVVTSCSGGTGSGVSPYITKAVKEMYPGKIVIFYGILPRLNGSTRELANSASCMAEIETLNSKLGIPYMLADLNYYDGISNEAAYNEILEKILSDVEVISGKYLNPSRFRMIDENDTKVVISAPGYMSIYRVDNITQQMIDKESVQSMIIKEIKHSPAVAIARDGLVEQMAVISNFPTDMEDCSKSGNYDEVINHVGRPLSIFENYAVISGGTGQIIMIFSGQSYPIGHMTQIDNLLKAMEEDRRQKEEARKSANSAMKSTYEFLQTTSSGADLLGKTKPADEETKKKILDGLFDI